MSNEDLHVKHDRRMAKTIQDLAILMARTNDRVVARASNLPAMGSSTNVTELAKSQVFDNSIPVKLGKLYTYLTKNISPEPINNASALFDLIHDVVNVKPLPSTLAELFYNESYSSNGVDFNGVADTTTMDNYVEEISDKLYNRVKFTATVIKEEISAMYNKFTEEGELTKVRNIDDFFNVDVINKPSIFDNEFIKTLINSHELVGSPVSTLSLTDIEDYIDLSTQTLDLTTGDGELDGNISTYLSEHNVDDTVLLKWITNAISMPSEIGVIDRQFNPVIRYFIHPLVLVLFLNNLCAKTKGLRDGDSLHGKCIVTRNYWLNVLKQRIKDYDLAIRYGDIINAATSDLGLGNIIKPSDTTSDPKYLVVYGEQLDKLQEAGINFDVLRGMFVSGHAKQPSDFTFEKVSTKAGQYQLEWEKFASQTYNKYRRDKVNETLMKLSNVYSEVNTKPEDIDEDLRYLLKLSTTDLEKIGVEIINYIENIDTSGEVLLLDVFTDMVCKIKYGEPVIAQVLKRHFCEDSCGILFNEYLCKDIVDTLMFDFVVNMITLTD